MSVTYNDNLSYSILELVVEVNECKNGIMLINSLPKNQQYIISQAFLNVINLVAAGILELCPEALEDFPAINGKSMDKIIKSTRLQNKIYSSQKSGKSIKKIKTNILTMNRVLTDDYKRIQIFIARLFGQDNLSIATTENQIFYSSHQIFEQMHELIYKENLNSLTTKNNILKYTTNVVMLITSFCEGIKNSKFSAYITAEDRTIDQFDINLIDDNIYNFRIFNKEFSSEIVLFFLKILTMINFTIYILPKIIKCNSNLYIRYKLLIYISSCKSLYLLVNNYNYNNQLDEYSLYHIDLILKQESQIINTNLRNNIFHYYIKDIVIKNDKNILEQIILTENHNSLFEYMNMIDKELLGIKRFIEMTILRR